MPGHSSHFVFGTHKVNALLRFVDWQNNPLGPMNSWPASLKTSLALVINSRQPMAIWWGPSLILLYNDAYRDLLPQADRDTAFGKPAKECFDEYWSLIGPQIEFVLAGQGSTWQENQRVTSMQDDKVVERWWTYGYSPVYDDEHIRGILVVCTELTEEYRAKKELKQLNELLSNEVAKRALVEAQLRQEKERINAVLDTLPMGMAIVAHPEGTITYHNPRAAEILGKSFLPDDGVNGIADNYSAIHPDGRLYQAEDYPSHKALVTGKLIGPEDMLYQRGDETIVLTARSVPVYDKNGKLTQIVTVYDDITEQRQTEQALHQSQKRDAIERLARRDDDHFFTAKLNSDEVLYRSIAKNLPSGAVFLVDQNLRYLLAEGPALRQAGMEPAHFEGKRVRQVVPPQQVEQAESDYRSALEGQELHREHEVNGQYFITRVTSIKDPQGKPFLALAFSYDITERRRNENRLQLLNEVGKVTSTAESGDNAMFDVTRILGQCMHADACVFAEFDADNDLVQLRQGWINAPELSISGAIPLSCFDHETIARLQVGETVVSCASGTTASLELQGSCDDLARYQAIMLCPLHSEGRLVAMMLILKKAVSSWTEDNMTLAQEIAELSWAKIERLQLNHVLRESDVQKDRFLATLSHELRSPLTAIEIGIDLLTMTPSEDIASAALARMNRQVNQLSRLVDDLLDISRIKHGKLELQVGRLDIRVAIEQAIETIYPSLEARRQKFSVTMSDAPMYVDADFVRLTQVFTNLLNNAVRYTPEEGSIGLNVEHDLEFVTVRIKDDGIGLDPSMLTAIFDFFVQADHHKLMQNHVGLGIGLSLVKQLVQLHGGTIEAQSPGLHKGSTFIVKLRLSPNQEQSPPVLVG